jgi:hypothetical protein
MRSGSRTVSHFAVDELLAPAVPIAARRRRVPSLKAATDMAWSGLLVATLFLAGAPGGDAWLAPGVFDVGAVARPALIRLDEAGEAPTPTLAVDPEKVIAVPLQAIGARDAEIPAGK